MSSSLGPSADAAVAVAKAAVMASSSEGPETAKVVVATAPPSSSSAAVTSSSEGSSAAPATSAAGDTSPAARATKKRKKKNKGKAKSKRRRLAELAKKGRENEVFKNLKESNEKEAKNIVSVIFPSKVMSLTEHIEQSAAYNVKDLRDIDADLSMCLPGPEKSKAGDSTAAVAASSSSPSSTKPDTSVYKLRNPFGDAPVPDAKVPCNAKVVSMMTWLRKEVRIPQHCWAWPSIENVPLSVSPSLSLPLCLSLSLSPNLIEIAFLLLALTISDATYALRSARGSFIDARKSQALDPAHGTADRRRKQLWCCRSRRM